MSKEEKSKELVARLIREGRTEMSVGEFLDELAQAGIQGSDDISPETARVFEEMRSKGLAFDGVIGSNDIEKPAHVVTSDLRESTVGGEKLLSLVVSVNDRTIAIWQRGDGPLWIDIWRGEPSTLSPDHEFELPRQMPQDRCQCILFLQPWMHTPFAELGQLPGHV
jgi:hypothetical protein